MAAEPESTPTSESPAGDEATREMPALAAPVAAPAPSPKDTTTAPAPAPAAAGAGSTQRISIAEHPQAARTIRRAREAAGLGGFMIGGWMSLGTHDLAGTLLRAVAAGAISQVVVWAAAVVLCRHLILAELRNRELALLNTARARIRARAGTEVEGARRA